MAAAKCLLQKWSCRLAFGFIAVSACCLSAETDAVACLLRPHLYDEALTCLAARILRCASAGASGFRATRGRDRAKTCVNCTKTAVRKRYEAFQYGILV
jgi:hypothetical protein